MRKSAVFLLALIMALATWGCNVVSNPIDTTGLQTTTNEVSSTSPTEETLPWDTLGPLAYDKTATGVPDTSFEIIKQTLPETVENRENLPVLKWVCLFYGQERTWNESPVVELNQMLADKGLPFRIQFEILYANVRSTVPQDWFTRPEVIEALEGADLIYAHFSREEMKKWLAPVTDYVTGDADPSLNTALPHALAWVGSIVDGNIYGIPQYTQPVFGRGWSVGKKLMDACGLSVEDFDRNFWEMDELFAEIYEKNGRQPFLYDSFSSYGSRSTGNGINQVLPIPQAFRDFLYQDIGSCFSIDLTSGTPTVVNYLDTDACRDICQAIIRYKESGYLTTSMEDVKVRYSTYNTTEPYAGQNTVEIPLSSSMLNTFVMGWMSGVSVHSSNKEACINLLNLIVEDEAFRLQLCYGKEGRDYTVTDGLYTLIEQDDGSSYSLDRLSSLSPFFEFTGADSAAQSFSPSTRDNFILTHEGKNRLESYLADMENVKYVCYPITFDYSGLKTELDALSVVMGDYYGMFLGMEHYTEENHQEMLQKMKEAGSDKVIAELQKQLDAWLAENPNWNPLG